MLMRVFLDSHWKAYAVVYSITCRNSFGALRSIVDNMRLLGGNLGPVPLMLVGNQVDQNLERVVSYAEGASFAKELGCSFVETSAKTAENVDKMFTDLVRAARLANPEPPVGSESSGSKIWNTLQQFIPCIA